MRNYKVREINGQIWIENPAGISTRVKKELTRLEKVAILKMGHDKLRIEYLKNKA